MSQKRDPFGAACQAYCRWLHQNGKAGECPAIFHCAEPCHECREAVGIVIRAWNEEGLTR